MYHVVSTPIVLLVVEEVVVERKVELVALCEEKQDFSSRSLCPRV